MVKTKVFKKITALTAAVALVSSFAAAANAASVNHSYSYASSDKTKVAVTATVTGTNGNQVTYYATKGSDVVYVDQKQVASNSAVFTYTAGTDKIGASVLVGETNVMPAEDTLLLPGSTDDCGVIVTGSLNLASDASVGEETIPAGTKKISVIGKAGGAAEYGIALATNADGSDAVYYQAFGVNNGYFAVQVYDTDAAFGSACYAAVYYTESASGIKECSDFVAVN